MNGEGDAATDNNDAEHASPRTAAERRRFFARASPIEGAEPSRDSKRRRRRRHGGDGDGGGDDGDETKRGATEERARKKERKKQSPARGHELPVACM